MSDEYDETFSVTGRLRPRFEASIGDTEKAEWFAWYLEMPLEALEETMVKQSKIRAMTKERFSGRRSEYDVQFDLAGVALKTRTTIGERILSRKSSATDRRQFLDWLLYTYDVCAEEIKDCGQPLIDAFFTETIPVMVFNASIDIFGACFLPAALKLQTETKLTEAFGLRSVPDGYEAEFKTFLSIKIDEWRACIEKSTRSANTPSKGDIRLLKKSDGSLKGSVTIPTAAQYAGVSRRAIEKAAQKGPLTTTGKRQNRRVSVESLLKYCPSAE